MFSLAIFGGILLNVGAFLMFRGLAFQAIIVYLFADICWVIMALQKDDFIGAVFIASGMILGFLAYLKMRSGKMHKSLNKQENKGS
jgi:nucleoside permease NupC